jgi:hypothetical protein
MQVRDSISLGDYLYVKIYDVWERNMTTRRGVSNWARPVPRVSGCKRGSDITEVRVHIRMASNRLSWFPRVVECGSLREMEGNLMSTWWSDHVGRKGLRLPTTTFSNPYDGKLISNGANKQCWSKRPLNYLHWYAQISRYSTLSWILTTIITK